VKNRLFKPIPLALPTALARVIPKCRTIVSALWVFASAAGLAKAGAGDVAAKRPNFLVVLTDDQSFSHTGFNGDPVVKTPGFDRIAREGMNFTNAFCSAPSCSPSRAALLTGHNFYELGPGSVLFSGFPGNFPTYQDILRKHGYFTGYTGKGFGPGFWSSDGRTTDPVGLNYNQITIDPAPPKEICNVDYFENFKAFLKDRKDGQPFSFWFGAREPHLPQQFARGAAGGKKLEDVVLPPYLVDTLGTRHSFLDYYDEIEWLDQHLVKMLDYLESTGQLENTVVIFTSDNGMGAPRAKGDLYDPGTRMPFALMWKDNVKGGRTVSDFVNLMDIAPTLIELAGLTPPKEMTARSLVPIIESDANGRIDPTRDFVVVGIERHDTSYPMRAIQTDDFLLIRNDVDPKSNRRDDFWDTPPPSPAKEAAIRENGISYDPLMRLFANPEILPKTLLAFGPRPQWELYDVRNDPWRMKNLAADPTQVNTLDALKKRMDDYLVRTGDPRALGTAKFGQYPHYGKVPKDDIATLNQIAAWKKFEARSNQHIRAEIQSRPTDK
jgi:uncharacterized sulfatase